MRLKGRCFDPADPATAGIFKNVCRPGTQPTEGSRSALAALSLHPVVI